MQKKLGTLYCGNLYFLTKRNDVAHQAVVETERARFLQPRVYGHIYVCLFEVGNSPTKG